jgi:hypothetical protein
MGRKYLISVSRWCCEFVDYNFLDYVCQVFDLVRRADVFDHVDFDEWHSCVSMVF